MKPVCLLLATAVVVVNGACVADSEEDLGGVEGVSQPVVGGQAATTCMWPNCLFGRGCSATLVHPRLTTTAAHCVQDMQTDGVANVGESAPFAKTVQRQLCRRPPQYTQAGQTGAYDIAFCLLKEPIENVPIVPILSACEAEQMIQVGKSIVIAGFGAPNNGRKFVGKMMITSVRNGAEVFLRGQGMTAGSGDSGGPAYIQMPDGTWRTFGVASRASGNNVAIYTLISQHIPWLEQTSGLDLTPCHNASGGWEDGPGCDRFPTDPGGTANGTYADFCAASPVKKPAPTCAADWQPGDGGIIGPLRPGPNGDGGREAGGGAAAADASVPPPDADVATPAPAPPVQAPDAAPAPPPPAPRPPDAAPAPAPPASTPSDVPAAGCSCSLGARGEAPGVWGLMLVALVVIARRISRATGGAGAGATSGGGAAVAPCAPRAVRGRRRGWGRTRAASGGRSDPGPRADRGATCGPSPRR
jgi:hypothetical protein